MSEGFDKRTHFRDKKSGKVIRTNPYRCYVTKHGTDSIKIFERDGVRYYENGEIVPAALGGMPGASEQTLDSVVSRIAEEPKVEQKTKTG